MMKRLCVVLWGIVLWLIVLGLCPSVAHCAQGVVYREVTPKVKPALPCRKIDRTFLFWEYHRRHGYVLRNPVVC
jgi:hypothetical protein